MLTRLSKTFLFGLGWFLTIMLFAVGFIQPVYAFIHMWQVELPASILLAACCVYFLVRPPKDIIYSRDELRFVIAPIVVFICWSALSALWAPSWKSAIHHALIWVLYLIFYLIVRQILETENGLRDLGLTLLGYLLIFSVGTVAGYVSFLIFGAGANLLGRSAKYGEQIVTILPLLLITVVRLNDRLFWMGTAAIALLWLLIFCSFGRINLFLFGIAFVTTAGLLVFKGVVFNAEPAEDAAIPEISALKKLLIITAAIIIAPALVQMFTLLSEKPVAAPVAFQRLADDEGLGSSNNFRKLMNSVSKEMILLHPIAGIGADNFGFQVNNYRKLYSAKHSEDVSLREAEDTLPERAHNEFLQIAAELGIVGVAIVLWLAAGLLLLVYRALNKWRSSPVAIAAVIGLGAFCVSSLVSSYSFRLVQNGFVFFFVLAIAYRSLESGAPNPNRENSLVSLFPSRAFAAAGLLACLLLVGYWTLRIASVSYSTKANYTQDLSEAERLYGIAERLDDENPDARYYHGMRLFQEKRYADAVPYLASAIKIGRGPAVDFSYLASAQSLSGNDTAAELTIREAYNLYPQSAFVMTRYSQLLKINGKDAESSEMLARARSRSLVDANTWWTLLTEGSNAAAMKAITSPDQYKPLMDLQPLSAVYAVRTERGIRFPEEKSKLPF